MIYSSFNYGHTITKENKFFPINEGSGEINIELRVRSYTLGQFVIELNRALNEFGSNQYQVILDRNTVKFGNVKFMTANITMQTNITQVSDCNFVSPIKPDPNGYENLRNFLLYATTKAPIEFVRNIQDKNLYTNCILESTTNDSNGTGFEIIQLYSRGLVGYYESGNLTFRAI
jgi:hypothetical protein